MASFTLWQFRYSHFNEKIRWVLDYKGIDYTPSTFLPGTHVMPALVRTGQRQLPILITDKDAVYDSCRISAHLEATQPDPPLLPSDPEARREALEWEAWLGEHYGPATRRLFFAEALKNTTYMGDVLGQGFAVAPAMMLRIALPFLSAFLTVDLQINEETLTQTRADIDTALERIDKARAETGFLVGDRFTIADLTAAALSAPLMHSPHFPYKLPQPVCPELQAHFDNFAQRDTIQWCLGLYEQYRRLPQAALA